MKYIYKECDMTLPFATRLKKALNTAEPSEPHNPLLLTDMPKAAERLSEAIKKGEKVIVAGDYDMDGVTATSIMKLGIESLGGTCDYMIPDRLKDGYGINMRMANAMKDYDLVITVDNGIAALDEIDMLSEHTDVIVTDHHLLKERLPKAYAVVDPHRDDSYPFSDICGAMVAFKLMISTADILGKTLPDDLTILAAMGTIADVMPLIDENRTYVKKGLSMMETSQMPFLKAMRFLRSNGEKYPDTSDIRASDIGFQIAPMINAMGRMKGNASPGVELFTTHSVIDAIPVLRVLKATNDSRKELERHYTSEALRKIPYEIDISKREPICVEGNWKKGVIGLVASKIVDAFGVPAFVVGESGAGSARSVPGVNIMPLLDNAAPSMSGYGGHPMAAGFRVKDFEEFRELIHEGWKGNHIPDNLGVEVTMEVVPDEINLNNIRLIDKLEPFGEGYPAPLFVCRGMTVQSVRKIGHNPEGAHLKLALDDVDAIWFWGGDYAELLHEGDKVDAVFTMNANTFRNEMSPQMMIQSIFMHPNTSSPLSLNETLNDIMERLKGAPVFNIARFYVEGVYGGMDTLKKLSDEGYISYLDEDPVTVTVGAKYRKGV